MNQREKEAVATLAYVAVLTTVGLVCWLQQTMAPVPWIAGPISLAYGLFMALTHDAEKRRGCVYDERDAAIEGSAWRAALGAAVIGFGLYVVAVFLVFGRMGDRWSDVSIPLATLPAGVITLLWAASVAWSLETLRQTRFARRVDADREPSA